MTFQETDFDHLPGDSLEQKLFNLQVCVELWRKFVEHRRLIPSAKGFFSSKFDDSKQIDFLSRSSSLLDSLSVEELEDLEKQIFEFSFD